MENLCDRWRGNAAEREGFEKIKNGMAVPPQKKLHARSGRGKIPASVMTREPRQPIVKIEPCPQLKRQTRKRTCQLVKTARTARLMPEHQRHRNADLACRDNREKFQYCNKAAGENVDHENYVQSSLSINWQTKRTTFNIPFGIAQSSTIGWRPPRFLLDSRLIYLQW